MVLSPLPINVYQEDLVETDFRKLWSDDAKEVELTLRMKQGQLEISNNTKY